MNAIWNIRAINAVLLFNLLKFQQSYHTKFISHLKVKNLDSHVRVENQTFYDFFFWSICLFLFCIIAFIQY